MSPEFDPLEQALRALPEPDAPRDMADIIAARVKHQATKPVAEHAKAKTPARPRRSWAMLVIGTTVATIGAQFLTALQANDLPNLQSLMLSDRAWQLFDGFDGQLDSFVPATMALCGAALLLIMILGQVSRSATPRL